MRPIQFGISVPTVFDYSVLRGFAVECEKLGYDSIWFPDHLTSEVAEMERTSPRPYKSETCTLLSALSTITKDIRLGPLVLCNSYRHPPVTAKVISTLDVVSNGRIEFGIGAGWNEEEYSALDIPFPSNRIRIDQLSEGVEIVKKLWTEERSSYEGRYYMLKEAVCYPKPLQKPHPPVTIGGKGEKFLLRVVAKHADRCNWWTYSVEDYKQRLKVLRDHCHAVGRPYEEIEKSCNLRLVMASDEKEADEVLKQKYSAERDDFPYEGWVEKIRSWRVPRFAEIVATPEECIERIQEYVDVGVTYFIFRFRDFPNKRSLRIFGEEVIPQMRKA